MKKGGGIVMECPACKHNGTRVVDSRPAHQNQSIRRRRECDQCAYRFTTFEKIEHVPLMVEKKDGSYEEFDGRKVLRGIVRACEKRPVPVDELEEIVYSIEKELRSEGVVEIPAHDVGEMVLERLAKIDEVAYVRFASVYRQYKDIDVFIEELKRLKEEK